MGEVGGWAGGGGENIYKKQANFLNPDVQCCCYRIFKFTITKLKYPLL